MAKESALAKEVKKRLAEKKAKNPKAYMNAKEIDKTRKKKK